MFKTDSTESTTNMFSVQLFFKQFIPESKKSFYSLKKCIHFPSKKINTFIYYHFKKHHQSQTYQKMDNNNDDNNPQQQPNDAREQINASRQAPERRNSDPPNYTRPAGRPRSKEEWSSLWKTTKKEAKSQRNRAEMLSKKCTAIETNRDELRLELEQARRQLQNQREDHVAEIDEVERDRRRYRQERDNLRSENRTLSDRNFDLSNKIDNLSTDRNTKQAHIANLNQRNLDLAKELNELKEKYNTLRTKQANSHYEKYNYYEDKNSVAKSGSKSSFTKNPRK